MAQGGPATESGDADRLIAAYASMRRVITRGLQVLLIATLLVPAGCVGTLATMVVKHVAMSAAKDVAKDQYKQYKARKAADQNARTHSPGHADDQPAGSTDDDSNGDVAP